jgi:hypothetical protein
MPRRSFRIAAIRASRSIFEGRVTDMQDKTAVRGWTEKRFRALVLVPLERTARLCNLVLGLRSFVDKLYRKTEPLYLTSPTIQGT